MESYRCWTDEDGKRVDIIPFIPILYRDEESRKLSKIYDVFTCPDEQILSSLGSSGLEHVAVKLLGIYKTNRDFIGMDIEALNSYMGASDEYYDLQKLISWDDFFRVKKVKGIMVLFPTENFLKNQGVKKVNHAPTRT